jgi:hypothetical protein
MYAHMRAAHLLIFVLVIALAGCSSEGNDATTTVAGSDGVPDVIAAVATQDAESSWTFSVTISSPYDSPERFADAWRVLDPAGNQLGERVLAHDHANEQPFTRSLSNVSIPPDVRRVTVEARDSRDGYGTGKSLEVRLTGGA